MKQLQTDFCVFTCHVSNVIGQPLLTNEDLRVNLVQELVGARILEVCQA